MERVLTMLGLAVKAGCVAIGEEPVGGAARSKKARVILLAQDAAPSTRRRAMSFAAAGGCLCLTIPADKSDLGRSLGHAGCAMCAITDALFASAVVNKLAVLDGAKYGPAAEALAVKARRAVQRRQEQARHLKNLQQGKRRVREKKIPAAPAAEEKLPAAAPVKEEEPPRPPRAHPAPGGQRSAQSRPPRPDNPHFGGSPHHGTGAHAGGRPAPRGSRPGGAVNRGNEHHSATGDKSRRPARPAETQKPRFSGSLPVKKGKGSKKSK